MNNDASAFYYISKMSKDFKISIAAELSESRDKGKSNFFVFKPKGNALGPYRQLFATSREANIYSECEKLNSLLSRGDRDFVIKGKKIRMLICGEQNIIENAQLNGNKAHVRHGLIFSDKYDILINPSHTNMGNLGKVHQRFSYLSKSNKIVIYNTNNKYEMLISMQN